MHAIEATTDDVAAALGRLGLNGYANDLADRWYARLDLDEAMSAADGFSGDMDEQTLEFPPNPLSPVPSGLVRVSQAECALHRGLRCPGRGNPRPGGVHG